MALYNYQHFHKMVTFYHHNNKPGDLKGRYQHYSRWRKSIWKIDSWHAQGQTAGQWQITRTKSQSHELFSNDNSRRRSEEVVIITCTVERSLLLNSALQTNLQFYFAIRIIDNIFKSFFTAISSKNRTD